MEALSLDIINSRAPYKVTIINNGDLLFTTDAGVNYSIGFIPDMQIAGCNSYQFFINRLSKGYQGYDTSVKATIFAIIEEFFRVNNDIMLYICDTSDGREEARNRLFIRWFREKDVEGQFVIKMADAVVEGQHFFTAIIVQLSHPHIKEIVTEFDVLAENLAANK